jgi:catechol 2,3-dioxygenase-like lactoylglutathione lyase family enzyme
MTSIYVRTHVSNGTAPMSGTVEMKLEMVVMPVSDADRAKEFYTNLGWRLDADFLISDDFRVVRSSAMSKPPLGMTLGGRSPTELLVSGRQSSPSGTAQARSGCADCSGERRSGERFRTMDGSSPAAAPTRC